MSAAALSLAPEPSPSVEDLILRLASARGVDEIIAAVRESARSLSGADGVTFVLRDNGMCHYADEDAISPLWKGQRFPMESCISGWAMLNRQPVVIEDIYADDRIPHAAYRPTFVRSLVMTPVREEDPVGAIGAYWARRHRPSDRAIAALQRIANSAAVAMTNVMLFNSLVAAKEEAIRAKDAIIMAMASLAETRDNDTGNHIRRTQRFVRALAEAARERGLFAEFLTPEMIELLYKSAPLHDIGKVGIPDMVLLKPGKLNDDEFAIMKTHAEIGRRAIAHAQKHLGSTPFLKVAQEIAHTHHERWDGAGYPRGLKGNEIPVAGRLMAIADVYDALVSTRVYKAGMAHDEAVGIIAQGAGAHFDPRLVDVFLAIAPAFDAIHRELADEAYNSRPGAPDH
ncbi:MAG: HD domain-containing protein [Rhizobiales bacterium]|nr:HD domain-containing protein [Hyphomicrobiales bacterium]